MATSRESFSGSLGYTSEMNNTLERFNALEV